MREQQRASFGLAAFALLTLASRSGLAAVDGCGNVSLVADTECEYVRGAACEERCDQAVLDDACEARYREACDRLEPDCYRGIDQDCRVGCSDSCEPECEAVGVECARFCEGQCAGGCERRCTALAIASCRSVADEERDACTESEATQCNRLCMGSCEGECEASCVGASSDWTCSALCEAACVGFCTHVPVDHCRIDCRAYFSAECQAALASQCEEDCEASGAIFCALDYVDHQGDFEGCRSALSAEEAVPVDASAPRDGGVSPREVSAQAPAEPRGCTLGEVSGARSASVWTWVGLLLVICGRRLNQERASGGCGRSVVARADAARARGPADATVAGKVDL